MLCDSIRFSSCFIYVCTRSLSSENTAAEFTKRWGSGGEAGRYTACYITWKITDNNLRLLSSAVSSAHLCVCVCVAVSFRNNDSQWSISLRLFIEILDFIQLPWMYSNSLAGAVIWMCIKVRNNQSLESMLAILYTCRRSQVITLPLRSLEYFGERQ